jgi:hypothetical protein
MPTLILAILVRIVVHAIGLWAGRECKPALKPLCSECTFAHIQFGASGRRAISCTFGGGVRAMKLDVLYCTDYRNRVMPARPAIGFVPNIRAASQ